MRLLMESIWKKMPLLFVIGIFVSLFDAFVLQSLWNWYAVPYLRLPEITFWATYGLLLLIQVIVREGSNNNEVEANKIRWDTIDYVMNLLLSQENIERVKEFLKEKEDAIWVTAGSHVFVRVAGNAVTLGTGWMIHAFLTEKI
jgi:hypothetical protein